MNGTPSPGSWQQSAAAAVLVLLLVAVGARVVWLLLAPLIPVLIVFGVLGAIGWFVFGRRH